MMKLNVQSKILWVLMTISILSLCSFGWVVYDSFTKDKEAYVIETLLSEAQSFTQLMNNKIKYYESYIVEKVSDKSKDTLLATVPEKLEDNRWSVLGSGIVIDGQTHVLGFSSYFTEEKVLAHQQGEFPFMVVDLEEGIFSYQIKVKGSDSKSFVVFKDISITQYLINNSYKKTYIRAENKLIGSKDDFNFGAVHEYLNKQRRAPFGFTRFDLENGSYFLAFSQLDIKGLTLFTMIKEDHVFAYKKIFVLQTAGFVILFLSISSLIGYFSANVLTRNLHKLSDAAESFGQGDFSQKVDIKTDDEFEVLGSAFNLMGDKINGLVDELKIYNTQLEEMVSKRTSDLNHLTRIQNAMLNSLGQSFTIFDQDLNVKPIYSKITTELLENDPVNLGALGVMAVPEADHGTYKELVEQLFMEVVEFEHLSGLLPEKRSNSKNDTIMLTYAPIRNLDTGKIEYILTIGTDKTQEILSMEKSEKEIQFSKMLLAIMRNPTSVKRMLKNSLVMIDELLAFADIETANLTKAIRQIHTLKGSFSAFKIKDVQEFANTLESNFEKINKEGLSLPLYSFHEQILGLKLLVENFIDSFGDLIKYQNNDVTVSMHEAKEFRKYLHSSAKITYFYDELFLSKRFKEYFELYPSYASDLSIKLGKKAKFQIIGGDKAVPSWFPADMFDEFIHLLRNSMDHGLEQTHERLEKGKEEAGQLTLAFTADGDKYTIEFKDDGKGIDLEALSRKDSSIVTMDDAINKIILGGLSAKDEVSEVSGRGVGVSAIIEKVQNLGGTYQITSEKNMGTTFTFVLYKPKAGLQAA